MDKQAVNDKEPISQILTEKLRDITLFRVICKPWKDYKIHELNEQYIKAGYGEQLKALKNTHTGERCFIIGNGPSLKPEDLEHLKNECTFAANRIFDIFSETTWRPWSYVVIDQKGLMTSNSDDIKSLPSQYKFLPYKAFQGGLKGVYWLLETGDFPINRGQDTTAYISEDISAGVSRGYTVTFISIQLAIYMGFKEIILLGVDFNYAHYIDRKGKMRHVDGVQDYFSGRTYSTSYLFLEPVLHAYSIAREYCDANGIKIFNATRGGKLEVFERVDFDSLFK